MHNFQIYICKYATRNIYSSTDWNESTSEFFFRIRELFSAVQHYLCNGTIYVSISFMSIPSMKKKNVFTRNTPNGNVHATVYMRNKRKIKLIPFCEPPKFRKCESVLFKFTTHFRCIEKYSPFDEWSDAAEWKLSRMTATEVRIFTVRVQATRSCVQDAPYEHIWILWQKCLLFGVHVGVKKLSRWKNSKKYSEFSCQISRGIFNAFRSKYK